MTAPTAGVRLVMLQRDHGRCAACGTEFALEAQHRQAVGMGGSKQRPTFVQLLTLCSRHNNACEAEMQAVALKFGWKVRGWVQDAGRVPVWVAWARRWVRLTPSGEVLLLTRSQAMALMREVYGDEYDEEKGLVA